MNSKKPTNSGARQRQGPGRGRGMSGSQAVVPKQPQSLKMTRQENSIIVPEGYTARKIKPAENYDVVSFARAMNEDFAPRVQKLFSPETEAAITAQKTGIYIGWRCPEFKHDCQRVNKMSRCFCGHLLGEHDKYNGHSVRVPCKQKPCACKAFTWIPSRPEDIGEFWFQRRRDFDPAAWRAKCRCKHTHEQHEPAGYRRCKAKSCSCGTFDSNFLCAACDKHWEQHETFFETEDMRKEKGLPVGEEYLPFAEMPELRNIALTGREDDDTVYRALTQGEGAIPQSKQITGNDVPVNFGSSNKKTGFRPTYD